MTTTREYLWSLERRVGPCGHRAGVGITGMRRDRGENFTVDWRRRGFGQQVVDHLRELFGVGGIECAGDGCRSDLLLPGRILRCANMQDGRGHQECDALRHQPSHGGTPCDLHGSGPPGHAQACQIPGMLCRQNGHVESLRMSIWLAVKPTRSTSILRHCGQ